MLTKDDFIRHLLGEAPRTKARATKKDTGHIEGFDFADDAPESEATEDTRFVTPLLHAGFGDGQGIPRATVIRSTDAVARYIPDEVRYWPKTPTRPHHTLLIEANLTHRELLAIPAFKSRQLAHLDIAEDAIDRLVAEALEGQMHETLCVVSIIDAREEQAGRIACFGTFNAKTEGLETFFLPRPSSTWDRAEARERLGLIYERQFKKLGKVSWQEAFTATNERKQAEKLLDVCTKKNVVEKEVQESILGLLDTIARVFGELITLLEPDKRLGNPNELRVQLPSSKEWFGVPPNLQVVGTMNTADRSIALMDVALRRRFTFEEMMPDAEALNDALAEANVEEALRTLVVAVFTKLNDRLRYLYDREHQIGHAYFFGVRSLDGLRAVFADRILPLLQEYFYGQWDKVALALGYPIKADGTPKEVRGTEHGSGTFLTTQRLDEKTVLGFDHDEYVDQVVWDVHPAFRLRGKAADAWLKQAFEELVGAKGT
jgi:hypothetical protein